MPRQLISLFVCIALVFSLLSPCPAQLLFALPKPGSMVALSPVFVPVLIKGLKVHPENPFLFDFIVDPGNEKLSSEALQKTAQRLVNYFLASLTVPEKDLWVNLSPAEKNHIIPDTLIKTELGRDLLAEDYMLKQISASLIYPDADLGKRFWAGVYTQAHKKFGDVQIPVNTFNKVWILPDKASVFERGQFVYIVGAHLKVMLQEDYLAQQLLGKHSITPIDLRHKDASNQNVGVSQVLRKLILPELEREVNEGKNFAVVRQVFYSLILAQWYQDEFKQAVLNKVYAGRNKVVGIDLSNPKNKDLIYRQYLAAYRKGVFNYIKEERFSPLDGGTTARKYFSGGFVGRRVTRTAVHDLAMAGSTQFDVKVDLRSSQNRDESWNSLDKPWELLGELQKLWQKNAFDRSGLYAFVDKYSGFIGEQKLFPVQSAWPVLKAITLLSKHQEEDLIKALRERYQASRYPQLVDAIFLMNRLFNKEEWLKKEAPYIEDRRIYLGALEIHYWTGGLGPVMEFHGKGMHDLGADVVYFEPEYQYDKNDNPLDYEAPNQGLKIIDSNFMEFSIKIGNLDGHSSKDVDVKVTLARDKNGIMTYLIRHVQPQGQSYYTKMLYNYSVHNNPVSKEESMAFFNVAAAELIKRLEEQRKKDQGESWKPAIVHGNDGQLGPLQAVTMSHFGSADVIKDIVWAFTTHTDINRGGTLSNWENHNWGINVFLKHMMGIKDIFINAFRRGGGWIDYTSGGGRLADFFGAVADSHANRMRGHDPNAILKAVTNGAVPEEMAKIYRRIFTHLKLSSESQDEDIQKLKEEVKRVNQALFEVLQEQGVFPDDADYTRPTAEQLRLIKILCKQMLNDAKIPASHGVYVQVDLDKPLIGYARRLVVEKAGRNRALTNGNIRWNVEQGVDVVLLGNNQHTQQSEDLAAGLRNLQQDIDAGSFPGRFRFVDTVTREQKILLLAALDIEVQDSDNNEANGAWEEDGTANGAYIATGIARTGVLADQGLRLDWNRPGSGNIMMPAEDTEESWRETLYKQALKLWHQDSQHLDFYKGSALGPRLERAAYYLITSAAYLRQYNRVLERRQKHAQIDQETIDDIVAALGQDKGTMEGILYNGRNGIQSFKFTIKGQEMVFEADGRGLKAFLNTEKVLKSKFGLDALLRYYKERHFQQYLEGLFHGTAAAGVLNAWLTDLDQDEDLSVVQQEVRLREFIDSLINALERQVQLSEDHAMAANPGGIKLDHIRLVRQGHLTGDVVTDGALENTFSKAPGVYGVIVDIVPIANLQDFIQ